jgi:hypothetical protein
MEDIMIPEYLLSDCAGKSESCRESYRCPHSVKRNPAPGGKWFITMGHAGFNSPTNNGGGYVSEQAAHYGIEFYLLAGKKAGSIIGSMNIASPTKDWDYRFRFHVRKVVDGRFMLFGWSGWVNDVKDASWLSSDQAVQIQTLHGGEII